MDKRGPTDALTEASRWIARLEADDVTLEDHQRFRAWLDAAPENRAAHEALSRTWDRLDALKRLKGATLASPPPSSPLSRRALLMAGGAATGLALAAGLGAMLMATPTPTYAASFQTPTGGRESAALQDGSSIELNAATTVDVAFTDAKRSATLTAGEALFEVAADTRPFEVRTAFGDFTAQAGKFLVKLVDGGVRASVFAGALVAKPRRGAPARVAPAQEVSLLPASAAIAVLPSDAQSQRLAWREGMLSFNGETLAEAAADVTRQTGVTFSFADPALEELRIGGYIDARSADAFLTLLQQNLGLSIERLSASAVLLRRRQFQPDAP